MRRVRLASSVLRTAERGSSAQKSMTHGNYCIYMVQNTSGSERWPLPFLSLPRITSSTSWCSASLAGPD